MSSSLPGRNMTVSWSDDDSTYHEIEGIDTFDDGITAPPINDNEFGVSWGKNVGGILSNNITMSGGLRLSDSTGQVAMITALKAGSFGYVKVLWDGTTNGYKQQVLVTEAKRGAKVDGRVTLSSLALASQGAPTDLP